MSYITTPPNIPFESGAQVITSAGALTLAHGLGVIPKLVGLHLKCLTAEYGYAIGDELFVNVGAGKVKTDEVAMSIVPDATNLNIRFPNDVTVFSSCNKATGVPERLTNANWELHVRAWK